MSRRVRRRDYSSSKTMNAIRQHQKRSPSFSSRRRLLESKLLYDDEDGGTTSSEQQQEHQRDEQQRETIAKLQARCEALEIMVEREASRAKQCETLLKEERDGTRKLIEDVLVDNTHKLYLELYKMTMEERQKELQAQSEHDVKMIQALTSAFSSVMASPDDATSEDSSSSASDSHDDKQQEEEHSPQVPTVSRS